MYNKQIGTFKICGFSGFVWFCELMQSDFQGIKSRSYSSVMSIKSCLATETCLHQKEKKLGHWLNTEFGDFNSFIASIQDINYNWLMKHYGNK